MRLLKLLVVQDDAVSGNGESHMQRMTTKPTSSPSVKSLLPSLKPRRTTTMHNYLTVIIKIMFKVVNTLLNNNKCHLPDSTSPVNLANEFQDFAVVSNHGFVDNIIKCIQHF